MRRPLRSDHARDIANLAIELGDPGRMARARRLYRSGGVGSISVSPARIDAVVHGSRPQPYQVSIYLLGTSAIDGPLDAEYLRTSCSCPDSAEVCKHALASVLSFAEEAEADPEILNDFLGKSYDDDPEHSAHEVMLDPFFTGSGDAAPQFELPILRFDDPSIVADGVDAWPILASALREIVSEISSR